MNQNSSAAEQSTRGVRYKVLLVDDDPALLRSLAAALELDFEVVSCNSAERALSLLKSGEFHAVCSEYAMPGMNGIELFERVAQLPCPIACLLLTGASSFIAQRASVGHYVLTKPAEPARLASLLTGLARTAQLKRQAVGARPAR